MMATEERRYNGWTNYETWNAKLWMDNDEGSYRFWQAEAQQAWDETPADDDRLNDATANLCERLKEYHEENSPDLGASFYSDILSAALSEVNWYEIAESLMEDVDKEADSSDESDDED